MKILITSYLFFAAGVCNASNYYLSASMGNDSRTVIQAQNPATPWKTIEKLNAYSKFLLPGDSIFFKKGEIFYGALQINNSGTTSKPIVFTAYGIGSKPIITSFIRVTGFTNKGNGIWQSDPVKEVNGKVNMLLINGVNIAMGRYPNADAPNGGFLTYTGHTLNKSITDNNLIGGPNWTGAQLILKKERWSFDRSTITAQSNNTIWYNFETDYEPHNGFGYFIENDIRTLDQKNEWYFNPFTKTVSIFNGNLAPSGTIQIATMATLATVKFANNIIFDGLAFEGSNGNLMEFGNQQNAAIKNCRLQYAGIDAIYGYSLINFRVQNSLIKYANNNGIYLEYNCKNTNINNDTVKNIGLYIGMGDAIHFNSFAGISVSGRGNNAAPNTIIEANVLDSIGYNGISFIGDNALVKNNFVTNFCMTKDDGGGIYCNRGGTDKYNYSGQRIIGNIILDGRSALNGIANKTYLQTWGIYIDDNTQGVDILNNTVANMPGSGIFLHNAHEISIKNNTLYNNAEQLRFSYDGVAPIRNVTVRKNIFYANAATQITFSFSSIADDMKQFGSSDSNIFSRPQDTVMGYIKTNKTFKTLAEWQAFSNQDAHSTFSAKVMMNLKEIKEKYIYVLLQNKSVDFSWIKNYFLKPETAAPLTFNNLKFSTP